MFKKFRLVTSLKETGDMLTDEMILNEAEEMCEEQYKKLVEELEYQQEEVLKLQSLLKLFTMKRRDIKKAMQDDFQKYCLENYNIPLVPLETFDGDDDVLVTCQNSFVYLYKPIYYIFRNEVLIGGILATPLF